jgi:hypothetical protein
MKIRITESQYKILVNKPRDVVFGNVNEASKPKETPEEIDAKIEEILNHVRNGGEFIRVYGQDNKYTWLKSKSQHDKTGKFKNVFDQIKKIQEKLDNKKIEEILNHVRNGGEFIRVVKKNDKYKWLLNKSLNDKTEEQKFKKALDQIYEIQEELENKKIEEILNHVRNGGEFIRNAQKDDNFKWLKSRLKNKTKEKKIKKAFDQIKKIEEEFENKKIEEILNHVRNGGGLTGVNYEWLKGKIRYDTSEEKKFKKAFDQIKKIQEELKNKKLEEILNQVRNGGGLSIVNYGWLTQKIETDTFEEKKFKKVLDQIRKIQEELENEKIDEKIEEILNHVRNGGSFIRDATKDDYYKWLYNKSLSDKTEEKKFQNALDQIYKIQAKLGIKREWWGERVIIDTLEKMGFEDIPQQGQHTYKDCKNSLTCNFYKFDIYLPYNENNYMVGKDKDFYIPETGIIFEYDGIQHFESIDYYGGEEKFIKRIHSDKEKNSYCQNNNIKLVRIPYTSKKITDIKNDIISALKNTDTFILTGDYPQLGWNQK